MILKPAWVFALAILLAATPGFAEENLDGGEVHLDLPLVDAPFNFTNKGYTFPSMRQSLAASTGFYETVHRAITGPPGSARWRRWIVIAPDVVSTYLPLGSSWLHEEWHRAVMSRRGIASYNDVNDFPVGRSLIAVSHETDEDLIRLKRDHPHEQVRLAAAGMESQTFQNLLFAKHHFFDDSQSFDVVTMAMNTVSPTQYLQTCSSSSADQSTDDQNRADGADIGKRDFIGLDCTGWARDLFRPDEPYTARGTHPSGTGVNRYTRYSDLTDEERSFLRKQFILSFVNFADPFLAGFDRFTTTVRGREVQWNARLSHYLTSFGYTVDANLFLRWGSHKVFVQLHNGFNAATYFPGITVELLEKPLPRGFLFSRSLTIWNQPRGQDVRSKAPNTMVATGFRLARKIGRITPYVGVEAKTPGWLAGNVYLDRNLSVWTGMEVLAF